MDDLIQLELHKFTEQVNELVDIAKNQEVNRKKLLNINKNWEKLSFNFK